MADLFWLMSIGAGVIWLIVLGLLVYALGARTHSARVASVTVWTGGIVVPCVVLSALLVHALPLMPALRAPGGAFQVAIEGHQYWWRVRYTLADGRVIETANELHLPAGRRVELILTSADVIHSFWIPSLAGKMDLIPGRTNRLVIEPERVGSYRGVCAELCGASHAFMALDARVHSEQDFLAWLTRQQQDAAPMATLEQKRGEALFIQTGCSACHAVRGTPANGELGPDLTHVGSRATIAAGLLPNNVGTLAGWIAASQDLKPGNRMPSIAQLPGPDLRALAAYLAALR